ncbi:hypothetical protein ENSA5_03860 [Enhygromyxa salina]|uniref:Uncharacterized protein n=1 Tax=Enhygromyxa salina TaxID=215803 RepID=A0A2S9YJI0_9BACT|nr:hypothetical protein [Enhygromyxa salina]PRQ05267.1 hypothetical protein ENSA5_03860 [Enhygromyxa salina]
MRPPHGHGHARLLTLAAFTLTLACAAQHEEANTMPSREAERAGDFEDRPAASEAVAAEPASEAEPERSLDDMERELALNAAKLRALGVALPSDGVVEDAGGEEASLGRADKRGDGSGPSGGGGAQGESAKPSSSGVQPGPKPTKKPRHSGGGRTAEKEAAPQVKNKDEDKGFAEPPSPEAAKATPLGPDPSEREQDVIGRCEQVCVLSQITCELNAQICELAGRHPDEDDYEAACERAAADCEVAQEACNECVG